MTHWKYVPNFLPPNIFEPLLKIIEPYCQTGYSRTRKSCLVTSGVSIYEKLPTYDWSEVPSVIDEIRKLVEQYTNEKYDYVLIHVYPEGSSSIGWHNDTEAMTSSIASISLGATRKFRFRTIGRTKGWNAELKLNNGDFVWMLGPDKSSDGRSCQEIYQHCVPIEKTVKTPRINLTFRQY